MAEVRGNTVRINRNTNRTNRNRTKAGRNSGYKRGSQPYVYDNTARKLNVQKAIEEKPKKRLSVATRKNRDKAVYMNLGYVLFLAAAMFITSMVLINYI